MTLAWRYLDANGAEAGRSEDFADRQAAEEWLRESWEELLDRGIEEVILMEEAPAAELYRMSLRP